MNNWNKLGLVVLTIGLIAWLSFIGYSIQNDTKKDYESRIKTLEYKVTVLENSINKKDTIVINLNQRVK